MAEFRVCGFTPARHLSDGNKVAWALGWQDEDGTTYSVPLGPSADSEPTHYGFSGVATREALNLLVNRVPPKGVPWDRFGLVETLVYAVGRELVFDAQPIGIDPLLQFNTLLVDNGLVRLDTE